MYQRASETASFLKIDRPFLVLANLPITQFPMTLLLVYTSWIIDCAHFITNNNTFSIIFLGRSSFYLSAVEASFIKTLD